MKIKRTTIKIIGVIVAVFMVCAIVGIVIFIKMTNLNYTKLDKSDASLGIKAQSTPHAIDQQLLKKIMNAGSTTVSALELLLPVSMSKSALVSASAVTETAADVSMLTMTTTTTSALTITAVTKPKVATKLDSQKPKTIALFGVDRSNKKSNGRSDIIMLLTIDDIKKKVKLSSIMRDLYVPIDGHGHTKLTHAYSYGGPQLALKTLNQNFGLDIRDFCTVDFLSMEKIIDAAGGIMIDLTEDERNYLHCNLVQTKKDGKGKRKQINKDHLQRLDGAQAVTYARIRYIGHGDFDRTGRQRKALKALIHEVKSMGVKDSISFLNRILPEVETSLTRLQIIDIVLNYFKLQPMTIEEERFPVDGAWKSANIKGIYYIKSDLQEMQRQLQRYIYQDIKPK